MKLPIKKTGNESQHFPINVFIFQRFICIRSKVLRFTSATACGTARSASVNYGVPSTAAAPANTARPAGRSGPAGTGREKTGRVSSAQKRPASVKVRRRMHESTQQLCLDARQNGDHDAGGIGLRIKRTGNTLEGDVRFL